MKRFVQFLCLVLSFSMGPSKLSGQNGFTAAYDAMHNAFSYYYPFGHWKAIKWDDLNSRIRPKIVSAGAINDTVAFYTALREYVTSVPDGNITLHGWDTIKATAMYRQIGGSYGFALDQLDDGRIVTRLVSPGSAAALGGMEFGSQVLEINELPVQAVMDTLPVLWAEVIPATMECKKMQQLRLIGRAPLGTTMKIKFLNRGASDTLTAVLTAADDSYATYRQTSMTVLDSSTVVSGRILQPQNFGYLKLTREQGEDSAATIKIFTDFRDIVRNFNNNGVAGMILDLRVNAGGEDALAAAITGLFFTDTTFYKYWAQWDPVSGYLIIYPQLLPMYKPVTLQKYVNPEYPLGSMYVEPQGSNFSKPVVVLVSPRSIGAGEGIPMLMRNLPNCKILGFHGSNGSFGVNSFKLSVFSHPDDLILQFHWCLSLDENYYIQVDSDSTMTGGIIPGIRVPLNDSVIDQLYLDSTDVELNYAIKELSSMLGVSDHTATGNDLHLEQNVPNPIESLTAISYVLPYPALVTIEIYDVFGRKLQTLINAEQAGGRYTIHWDARNRAPGLYFYRITAGNLQSVRKCMVK